MTPLQIVVLIKSKRNKIFNVHSKGVVRRVDSSHGKGERKQGTEREKE